MGDGRRHTPSSSSPFKCCLHPKEDEEEEEEDEDGAASRRGDSYFIVLQLRRLNCVTASQCAHPRRISLRKQNRRQKLQQQGGQAPQNDPHEEELHPQKVLVRIHSALYHSLPLLPPTGGSVLLVSRKMPPNFGC